MVTRYSLPGGAFETSGTPSYADPAQAYERVFLTLTQTARMSTSAVANPTRSVTSPVGKLDMFWTSTLPPPSLHPAS
jgi:hypothetical protein